jgi:glycosyltransferase involved in cell wall biosynthesis
MSRILLVTDAWKPQVSGVVRTIEEYVNHLRNLGHIVVLITPDNFCFNIPCPTYPEIRLSLVLQKTIGSFIYWFNPDHIHVFTEGLIGIQVVRYCNKNNLNYTTSLLTRFDTYVELRFKYLKGLTRRFMRWFHSGASKTFVSTELLKSELESLGFKNLVVLPKGIDAKVFNPLYKNEHIFDTYKRPILLYVGRISVEKNLEEFYVLIFMGLKYWLVTVLKESSYKISTQILYF